MRKLYRVRRFREFPKRQGIDRLKGTFKTRRQAEEYSTSLNAQYNSRYYVEVIEVYPNESAIS